MTITQTDRDFTFENHGSICLLRPITEEAEQWVEQCIDPDHQEFAGAVVIEPRYVENVLNGIECDGLIVK